MNKKRAGHSSLREHYVFQEERLKENEVFWEMQSWKLIGWERKNESAVISVGELCVVGGLRGGR